MADCASAASPDCRSQVDGFTFLYLLFNRKPTFINPPIQEAVVILNPWQGLKNLPREVWILSVATFINRAGTMALPFLTLYTTRKLGHSAGQGGFALT